jgi:hypothetical protein
MSRRWAADVGVGSVEELMGRLAAEIAVVRFAEVARDEPGCVDRPIDMSPPRLAYGRSSTA